MTTDPTSSTPAQAEPSQPDPVQADSVQADPVPTEPIEEAPALDPAIASQVTIPALTKPKPPTATPRNPAVNGRC